MIRQRIIMYTTKTNDVTELAKLSLSTVSNIGQMAHYRYQYVLGKELQKDSTLQISANELNQNRDKMILHTCLAGLCVIALFTFGIASLNSQNKQGESFSS